MASASSKKAIFAALAGNGLIALTKSIACGLTGSSAMRSEGVHHLLHPVPIENPFLNYIVPGLAMLFEGAAWYFALTEFTKARGKWGYLKAVQRGKDPALFVVLFEDSAVMLGLSVALVGIFLSQITGNPI